MLSRSPATASHLLRSLQRPRGFSSSAAAPAAKADDGKIVASVLFERLPVVIPKIHPVIYAFQEFSFRWRQQYRRQYPEEVLGKADARGKGDYQIDYVPAPRTTEADKTNDRKSLQRALDNKLYLLLYGNTYGAPDGKPVWHFPEKVYENEETMRLCAESALKSVIGGLNNTYFVGNAPMAHMVVEQTDSSVSPFKGRGGCELGLQVAWSGCRSFGSMQVPVGFLGKLWSFVSFLPFFLLLLLLGSIKAVLIGPVAAAVIFLGNSAVIIGLWPAHFVWTYYCVLKTERIGFVLKTLIAILLPLPLLLLPVFAIAGSLLGGAGYGLFVPLMATFEAVGEGVADKLSHCFLDGTVSTIAAACTIVRDVTDFCFHSYFSFMDDLIEKMGDDEAPVDIKCTDDKWGGFVEKPLHVVEGMAKEASFRMGLAYMISAVAFYDEYSNDLLYLREGSCLPRPKYRKADIQKCEADKNKEGYTVTTELEERQQNGHHRHRRVFHRSKTFTQTIQRLRPIQIWDWFFRSCELNGRILLSEGLITAEDMEECITNGKGKKLSIKLPAWCILQCLIRSAKSDSHGLLISDNVEVTNFNWPKDKVFDWMLGPLLVIKEQMKKLELTEEEEMCLRKLIMTNKNEKPSDWDNSGFPSDDNIKRGQLQAIIRRLQGIAGNMSRIPSFRRRFMNLVKTLYLEAIEAGAIDGSRDVKRRVKADVASEKIGDKNVADVAGSSDDTLGNIDMV
ncbi:hypothetical protein EJB05_45146 [Eragrostis curvula]|uniref:Ribosomal protein L46 N-terminal domain-containing protein n=1 Tax=Eragrostis curvula TaxID=38414 RepID=A0A5J9TJG5_9POAL|nr:hypothetical protein EJB05_45146 [Eragrostis curvula]